MALSTQEMLLALRAPNAHWLAALVNALDEAMQDPEFSSDQRALVRQLLDAGIVPTSVARAAEVRFDRFEASFAEMTSAAGGPEWPAGTVAPNPPARPKLTLVGNAAA